MILVQKQVREQSKTLSIKYHIDLFTCDTEPDQTSGKQTRANFATPIWRLYYCYNKINMGNVENALKKRPQCCLHVRVHTIPGACEYCKRTYGIGNDCKKK